MQFPTYTRKIRGKQTSRTKPECKEAFQRFFRCLLRIDMLHGPIARDNLARIRGSHLLAKLDRVGEQVEDWRSWNKSCIGGACLRFPHLAHLKRAGDNL